MAQIEFNLGRAIPLNTMLPNGGGQAVLPQGLQHVEGLYIIRNINTENRYMGISRDIRNRFAGPQGTCFELGFNRNTLDNIYICLLWNNAIS